MPWVASPAGQRTDSAWTTDISSPVLVDVEVVRDALGDVADLPDRAALDISGDPSRR